MGGLFLSLPQSKVKALIQQGIQRHFATETIQAVQVFFSNFFVSHFDFCAFRSTRTGR
jgi:hypothetical protein